MRQQVRSGAEGNAIEQQIQLDAAPTGLTRHRRPLHALTGIRFFAAIYVVLYHSPKIIDTLSDSGWVHAGNFVRNGYLAVPLFFMLSGFILAYTYAGQIETRGDRRRFWEARFARIWPVYALSLFLSALPPLHCAPIGQMLAAVFMVQAWDPFWPALGGAGNFVCWTLSVEAFFYLCFPWAQRWIEARQPKTQLIALAAMLAYCVAIRSAFYSLGTPRVPLVQFVPQPILHLGEFLAGVCIGNYILRHFAVGTRLPGRGAWTYGSALLTTVLLCCASVQWTSLVVLGFSALIYGLGAERSLLSRVLSTRLLLLGGGVSYSIYLMQVEVKGWVILAATRLHLQSPSLRLIITTAILLILSLALFEGVEQPSRKILRSFFARLEQRRMIRLQG
jgi:peptidoglycan/LPS O-acetylase OafA/YrhL